MKNIVGKESQYPAERKMPCCRYEGIAEYPNNHNTQYFDAELQHRYLCVVRCQLGQYGHLYTRT